MTEREARSLISALVPHIRAAIARAIADGQRDYDVALLKATALLQERIARVEARPQVPGPAGEPGPQGPPGRDGIDGKPGLEFVGVYADGKSYEHGQLVTHGGSSWHCNEATTSRPGDGNKAWTLMVKRGRDARDRA